jgi:phage RecT family recombinase
MTGTAVATLAESAIDAFWTPVAHDLETALPPTVDARRFQSAIIIAIQTEPKILKCDPASVRNALMKCASDGLVPDGRSSALVPFYDSEAKCLKAQYIPMVQGIRTRARELGDILSINAQCVYANDTFVVDESDISQTEHKRPMPLGSPRGDIVGAYAIFKDGQGRVIHREIMDLAEINKIRCFSKAKNSPAWTQWFSEMARKTVIRRGSKSCPMSDALRRIIECEDEHVAFDRSERPERGSGKYNPLVDDGGNDPKVIDHDPADKKPSGGSQRQDGGAPVERSQTETGTTSSVPVSIDREMFRKYSAALARGTQAKSLPTIGKSFWDTTERPKDDPSIALIEKIYGIHLKRVAGEITAEQCTAEVEKAIA